MLGAQLWQKGARHADVRVPPRAQPRAARLQQTSPVNRSPPSSTNRPLDDAPRSGPELWRELGGVSFCHWDRWLLKLALDERDGLRGMRADFRVRMKNVRSESGSEAMIAQIDDLQARLASLGMTPSQLLDDEERGSDWLKKKAFKRVWHDGPHAKTHAMLNPPRRVLELRALRGHWPSFPVSPAQYERAFADVKRDAMRSRWSDTSSIAITFEEIVERENARLSCPYRQLALRRCALTTIIECMDDVDDSGGDMAEAYRSIERGYVDLVRGASLDILLRDLLELAVWEAYGLTEATDSFLPKLSEDRADVAVSELARIITELRTHELEYQLRRARELRELVLSSLRGRRASALDDDT
jgi:hypothetical protein